MQIDRPKARLISLSPIADDPRVRRMGDSLASAGWDVVGIGVSGAVATPPAWPIREARIAARDRGGLVGAIERAAARGVAASLGPVETALADETAKLRVRRIRQTLAESPRPGVDMIRIAARRARSLLSEGHLSRVEKARRRLRHLAPAALQLEALALAERGPALWIANDWWTLPAAADAHDRHGGVLAYDSHELATEEYGERPEWVRFQKPIVEAVEGHYIRRASIVTSVSPGITEHLKRLYELSAPTATLRNAPPYQKIEFRKTGERVGILYHGIIAAGRGLECAIDSLPLWRPEFALHLRGPAPVAGYLDSLRRRAADLGVLQRLTFHLPAPMTELVAAAAPFDIGLLALPTHSLHNRHALPNKLFEYLMAGLALAVTDLPEMAHLVSQTGAGFTFARADPAPIADAINSLDRDAINRMRLAALEAATRLNWEAESPPVLAAYAELMRASAARTAA